MIYLSSLLQLNPAYRPAADGGCLNCISWELDVKDTVDIPVVPCPACGGEVQALYGICPRCGWEYDGVAAGDEFSGANNMTLDAYKNQWQQRGRRRAG